MTEDEQMDMIKSWELKSNALTHDDIMKVYKHVQRKKEIVSTLEDLGQALKMVPSAVSLAMYELECQGMIDIDRTHKPSKYTLSELSDG